MLNISMETEFPGSSASLSVSWVTVSAWAVSLAASPLIVHLCRSHSVRLTAVIGRPSLSQCLYGDPWHVSWGIILGVSPALHLYICLNYPG